MERKPPLEPNPVKKNRRLWISLLGIGALGVAVFSNTGIIDQPVANTEIPEEPVATVQILSEIQPTATLLFLTPTALPATATPTPIEVEEYARRDRSIPILSPTINPTPTPLPTPIPKQPTPLQEITYPEGSFDLIKVLSSETSQMRDKLKSTDPEFYDFIDPDLNIGRVNILLSFQGTLWEKPSPPVDFTSEYLISCIQSQHVANRIKPPVCGTIYFNHDAWAILNRSYLQSHNQPSLNESKLGESYGIGGADLVARQISLMSGLSVDYHIFGRGVLVREVVNDVFQSIIINNPYKLDLDEIMVNNIKYPGIRIPQGQVKLNGLQAMQLIVGHRMGEYQLNLENESSLGLLLQAIITKLKNSNDIELYKRVGGYGAQVLFDPGSKGLEYHPNPLSIVGPALLQWTQSGFSTMVVPQLVPSLYAGPNNAGGSGFEWAPSSKSPDVQSLLKDGKLLSSMAVPLPYYDEATNNVIQIRSKTETKYFREVLYASVRKAVRNYLQNKAK